jgi:cytoskeletal protein RodZ
VGRTLSRVAGIVSAGALITFAAAPAALAQDETSTSPTETTPSTSETSTSSSSASTTAPSSASVASTTKPSPSTNGDVKTTEKRIAPKAEPEKPVQVEPKAEKPQEDNVGHGFVGVGGEGILVVSCAAGAPGNLATQYLTVTGGPDQDEANGLWNYTVRVVDAPAGTTSAKFSWTCGGVEGNGTVDFEQEQQPPTSTVTATSTSTPSSSAPASSTAPLTTAPIATSPMTTATSTTPAGNAAPKAQVKVAPKGGVETGFGGTAW